MVGKALPPLRFHLRACGQHFFWKFGPLALNHGHDAAIAPGGADFESRAVPKLCLQIPAKQENRQREVPDEILQREKPDISIKPCFAKSATKRMRTIGRGTTERRNRFA
jgi:hypothetical protein